MIYEYALEPKMVAAWSDNKNYRCLSHEFGLQHGRFVSRYPKKWIKEVWASFDGKNQSDRIRMDEIIMRLKETMIKRKDCIWDKEKTWKDNAIVENDRHPFRAILTLNNPEKLAKIIVEEDLVSPPCPVWDNPHGVTVSRKAPEMAKAIKSMLTCCRWVKFIDPYFAQANARHEKSWSAFMKILGADRPGGPLELIEIHTKGDVATNEHLKDFYTRITPAGMQVFLYQWRDRPIGQKLHNRFILTDLGGVSFQHGLDPGADGETDNINRLDVTQYEICFDQYNPMDPAFDHAAEPLEIIGTFTR